MDSFVAFRDHRPDALKVRSLGRPVARRPRTVLLARKHDQRRAVLLIAHGGIVDGGDLLLGEVGRVAAFGAGGELVADAYVREGAADHHLVVAAS